MDFDIIWILKNHIGYDSWSDVPMEQRELAKEVTMEWIHFPIGILSKRDIEGLINQDIEQEGF